jgi:energy-coupling factor transport system substrate-specific component
MRVKTPKPFSITIQCVVTGLLGFLVGTHWLMAIGCVVGGVIADLITSAGKYRNFKLTAIGYAAFCLCVHLGGFLLVFVARDYYYNYFITNGMDVAWSDAFFDYMSLPLMIGTGALAMVCAIVGMLLGKALLKKHFVKAGMV